MGLGTLKTLTDAARERSMLLGPGCPARRLVGTSMTEEWRPIPGYEGWYSVSNTGRVRKDRVQRMGKPAGYIVATSHDRAGYVRAKLGAKRRYVHRLVAAAFVGPCPPGQEVNHIDNDKANNGSDNLEYTTRSGNMIHIVNTKGSSCWARKLDDQKVREIRALVASGVSQSEAGRRFGVGSSNINAIVHRKQWKHVK